mmetsp:Transcript_116459/g.324545  ORF Transcript_116459/g.324545 Transcript_116459/m.324545 type:complete len:467 (+) Transcript_116459:100-1500(+)
MPAQFGPDISDSDSDEDRRIKRDEYGDIFEDYGFLKRAEEYKEKGNSEFKKERYERALKEYDLALEQLLTVAYDKSITLGKRKWNDVVVMRSTIHLNKSTCHYKLERWKEAVEEANECLVGNIRDEQMFTDPHIRHKVKQAERKHGRSDITLLEQRLPRHVRAKAWFRLSRCYAHLEYMDRAKDALAKSLEMCEDPQFLAEMSQHSVRIDVLEKQQRERQKKQFKGFWDKLQDRGGYFERAVEKEAQRQAEWDSLNYEEKFYRVQELDDSEDEDELHGSAPPQAAAATQQTEAQAYFEEALRLSLPSGVKVESAAASLEGAKQQGPDESFEANWAQRGQNEERKPGPAVSWPTAPPPREDVAAPVLRPRRSEEAPLRWTPAGVPRVGEAQALGGAVADPAEAWARREEEAARKERRWRMEYERRQRNELEDEELRRARERVAQQQQEAAGRRAKARLDALDNSDED